MTRRNIGKVVKAVNEAKTQRLETLATVRDNPDGSNPNPRPNIARRPRFR